MSESSQSTSVYEPFDEQNDKLSNQASSSSPKAKAKKSASAFRTISEVADILSVQQHVLRFWETKFTQVKPLKRGGGRRYYRPEDIEVLQRIHQLLYTEGYTIKGVQKLLRGHGKSQVANGEFKKEQAIQDNHAADAQSGSSRVQSTDQQSQMLQQDSAAGRDEQNDSHQAKQDRGLSSRQKAILRSMLGELRELRDMVDDQDED